MNNQIIEYIKKISIATSYLSSCIKNNDPIQNALQEKSILFLNLFENSFDFDLDFENFKQSVIFNIQKVISLLEVARASGAISKSQADIFLRNLNNFKNFIQSQKVVQTVSDYLSQLEENLDFKSGINNTIEEKKNAKQNLIKNFETKEVSKTFDLQKGEMEETKENKVTEIQEENADEDESAIAQTIQEIRRQKIMNILKNRASNLTEIKSYFENITPKTLQRDISDLVKEKKIIRLGDRRWAKYYLK